MSSYSCSVCNFVSKTKGTVKTHCNNICVGSEVISNIVLLKCDVCGKECETEKLMNLHKKNCVKKTIKIINEDKDGELKKKNQELLEMIKIIFNELDGLKNENNELKKRIDKLELKEEEEKVEGTVEGDMCEYCKVIKFIPTSKQQIKNTLVDMGYTNYKTVGLTIDGQRSLEMQGQVHNEYIEVNGDKYFYKPDKKQRGTGLIKILVNKYCDQEAVKNGRCERHQ